MSNMHNRLLALVAVLSLTGSAQAQQHKTYGLELEGFDYPYEVHRFAFTSQGADLQMGYMDVKPHQSPNGRLVVLLHGRNFCAATWEQTITVLAKAGYRVVAPDQIGFCKSSKPAAYQFSIQELATNTNALLSSLGVSRAIFVGHSFGGMMSVRYALMFPDAVEQMVLVNPIGLEDWQAEGVPYLDMNKSMEFEKKVNFDNIKGYERAIYYAGEWKPEYDRWVEMLAGMYHGPGRDRILWNQTQIVNMATTEPVVHEFEHVRVPTVLMIGQLDRTAIGADRAAPDVARKLGNYPLLGRAAAKRIPNAKLIEFPDLGHAPQIQAPDRFHDALLKALAEK